MVRAVFIAALRGARAAVTFLTRVPVGGFPYASREWRWCAAWFPLVGALVGAAGSVVMQLTQNAGPWASAALAIAATMMLTGAFHEDGLANTADALGGAYDRDRLFAILKDSRIGAFGAAALGIALLLRVALLARLDVGAAAALVLVHAASRLPPVWLMAALPYVSPGGLARSRPVATAGAPQVVVASASVVALSLVAWSLGAFTAWELVACGAAMAATPLVCGWRFVVRAGGITGDFLGATQQVSECALLLAVALVRGDGS